VIGPIVRLANKNMNLLLKSQREEVEEALSYLQRWRGMFGVEGVGSTIYSYWQLEFLSHLFRAYTDDT